MSKLNLKINGTKYRTAASPTSPLESKIVNSIKSINDSFQGVVGQPIYFSVMIHGENNINFSITHRGVMTNFRNCYKELLDESGVATTMLTNAILARVTGNNAFIQTNPFARKEEKRKLII